MYNSSHVRGFGGSIKLIPWTHACVQPHPAMLKTGSLGEHQRLAAPEGNITVALTQSLTFCFVQSIPCHCITAYALFQSWRRGSSRNEPPPNPLLVRNCEPKRDEHRRCCHQTPNCF